jgi:hypothetical protein
MQIVIDIPDGCYEELNNGQFPVQDAYRLVAWIKDGIQLPKGHGRLIDESDLIPDSDYEDGMFYAVSMGAINGAPTIIEADMESEEEE